MKSIFILYNHGISITILKKLYDLEIAYIDLEFFGKDILKEKGISKSQSEDIMTAFLDSKDDLCTNILNELQCYNINRNIITMLNEKEVSLDDIEKLNDIEFCDKFDIKPKYYAEIKNCYDMLKNDNFHVIKKDDYSKYVLKLIKDIFCGKKIEVAQIISLLLNTTYPISNLNKDLDTLVENNEIVIINDKISMVLPSIITKIKDLEEKKQNIVLERLNGKTLQEIADIYNLTRERIRQIIEKIYSKTGLVKEDQYQDVYEKYELSEEQFTTIFNENKSTYYYLFDKYKKGNLDFTELEKEYFTDEEMLKRIRSLKNEICLDNVYVNGDRTGVTKYYLKYKCNGEIKIKDLFNRINDYIINDLSNYKIEIYDSIHNLEALLTRKNWCISGNKNTIRYYEMDLLSENDLVRLKEMLNVEYGLYSSLYFYENNHDLMEELDIRNEQELHNLLKNLIFVDNITYLRMPNILIGYTNKEDFFKDKMTELSPLSVSEFLQILRKDYGHREDTMLSYLILDFKEYITGDSIVSDVIDLPLDSLKELVYKLNKYVYSVNEFREILYDSNISDPKQILNNINLKKLNYKLVGSYVIKNTFNTLEEAFYNAIIRGELSHSFLAISSTSYAIINKLEKEFKVIEIDKKYYAFERLYNIGLTKEEILDFINVIKANFSINNLYITPTLIRKRIDHSLLQNTMVNDSIICSLIKLIDSFKKITWHDNIIFCYSPDNSVSRRTFLQNIIEANKDIKLSELQNLLKNEYGVILNQEQIKYIGYDIGILFNNGVCNFKDN